MFVSPNRSNYADLVTCLMHASAFEQLPADYVLA